MLLPHGAGQNRSFGAYESLQSEPPRVDGEAGGPRSSCQDGEESGPGSSSRFQSLLVRPFRIGGVDAPLMTAKAPSTLSSFSFSRFVHCFGSQMTKQRMGWIGMAISFFLLAAVLFFPLRTSLMSPLGSVLTKAQPFKVMSHPDPPSTLWGSVTKPYPTGAFWTNLVVKNGDGPIALHPYGVKCLETGVHVSYGPTRRSVTQLSILDAFATDLVINSVEAYVGRGVERYDNGSVRMAYTVAAPAGTTGTSMSKYRAHLVKGSSFVTVAFDNATPAIESPLMKITAVDARVRNNAPGMQYIVTLGNFQRWLVYCSEPVALIWRENGLTAATPIRGVIRVAILPQLNYETAFEKLMNYIQCYPTGVATTLTYSNSNNGGAAADRFPTLTMVFQTNPPNCGAGLLMYALPHHVKSMAAAAAASAASAAAAGGVVATTLPPADINSDDSKAAQAALQAIYSIKGKLRALVGDTWVMRHALPFSPGWNYAVPPGEKLSTVQMDQIAVQLMQDVKTVIPTALDPYSFGKQVSRMARLALIADYLGIPEARTQALETVANSMIPWLTGANANALVYDRVWGGLVPTNGLADSQADFGSGWYSDHHFHYGYFIYAAAVLAKLNTPFYDANKATLDAFVRDVCNPDTTDLDFPIARHKDFFDGHSWASGLFQQANGKGQESSSEAVNAYYACYLFALGTNNKDLKDFSYFLLASEVQAAQTYWHMPNDDIYDSIFAANGMVGNIGAFDVTASTWFGSEMEYVYGINTMPVTPASALLLDQPYVSAVYPLLASRLLSVTSVSEQQQLCSANNDCVALGLTSGNCCPSPEGVSLACCEDEKHNTGKMQDEWRTLIYVEQAVINKEAARQQILAAGGFGIGNSKTNSLFWATTRVPPASPVDVQPHSPDYAHSVKSSCSANSACDSAGEFGSV